VLIPFANLADTSAALDARQADLAVVRSLAKFLTRLHSDVLDHYGEVHNFASLLRYSCLIYRSKAAAVTTNFLEGPPPRLVAAE
jgi:hypothetical protein